MFHESRKAELDGFAEKRVFRDIERTELGPQERLLGSRFVDIVKDGKPKSRLVAQNYADYEEGTVPTKASTVTKASERVCLAFSVSLPGNCVYV